MLPLPWEAPRGAGLPPEEAEKVAAQLLEHLIGIMRHLREQSGDSKLLPQGTLFHTHGDTAIFVVQAGKELRVLECKILREAVADAA